MFNPTTRFRLSAFLVLGALLGGCDTIQERVRTTREVPVFSREFEGTADAVLAVAPAVLNSLGFSVTDSSAAHGEIEAISDVRRDSGMRNSTQTRLKLTVVDRDGGYCLATIQAWEMREDENTRGERFTAETGIVNPSFHNSVFDAIAKALPSSTK